MDSHGEVTWSVASPSDVHPEEEHRPKGGYWQAQAKDGSWARFTGWQEPRLDQPLHEWAEPPAVFILLVRRGGYAVAVASSSGDLVAHKVGTRHVQSRTAAGGWSQQRFARRRANQADALVDAVIGHATRIVELGEPTVGGLGGVVTGGDRTLASQVWEQLTRGPLGRLRDLPVREVVNVPDPRRAVLDAVRSSARAIRVQVYNA